MGDAAAALLSQVGGGFVACLDVVDDDPCAIGDFFYSVEEYDGYFLLDKGGEVVQVFFVEGEGGDESIHPFVKEVVGVGGFFPIGFGGMADDEVVACLGGDFFDASQDGADELAFQFVYDNADRVCFLHPEVAGKAVGAVAHFAGHIHDPFPGLYIDHRVVF